MPPSAKKTKGKTKSALKKMVHIQSLPDEMLSDIFRLFTTEFTSIHRYDAHFSLMLVCRRWHQVVLTTPALWAALSFDAAAPWPESRITAYVDRSKASKLSVAMFGSAKDCAKFSVRLQDHLARIVHLEISTYQASLVPVWPFIVQMTQLEHLELANRGEVTFKPSAEPKLAEIHLPNLRYVYLEAIDMPWRLCQFLQLRELRILHFFLQPVVAVEHFLQALDRCISLLKLSIILKLPYAGVQSSDSKWYMHPLKNHLVTLPELRTLELSGYLDTQIMTLAMSIHAPKLDTAVLTGMSDPKLEEDWSNFDPEFSKLRSLTLGGWNDVGTLLERVIQSSSSVLRSLDITLPESIVDSLDLFGPPVSYPSSDAPTVDSIFAKARLPSLQALRTRNVPLSTLRRMIENQKTVQVAHVYIGDTGLVGDGTSRESFLELERDAAWLREKVQLDTFGDLSGLEVYASWKDKIDGRIVSDSTVEVKRGSM